MMTSLPSEVLGQPYYFPNTRKADVTDADTITTNAWYNTVKCEIGMCHTQTEIPFNAKRSQYSMLIDVNGSDVNVSRRWSHKLDFPYSMLCEIRRVSNASLIDI